MCPVTLEKCNDMNTVSQTVSLQRLRHQVLVAYRRGDQRGGGTERNQSSPADKLLEEDSPAHL